MIYALWGFFAGVVVVGGALLIALRPAKAETANYARHEAQSIARRVEEILSLTTEPATLRRAIRSLEDFESVIVMFHDGRRLSPGDAELLNAIRAGIARLRERVSSPVVKP